MSNAIPRGAIVTWAWVRARTFRSLVLILALAGFLTGAPASFAQTDATNDTAAAGSAAGDAGDYRLGTGDAVRVTVFGHEDLSGEFEVAGSGRVSLPLVGEVQAGGLTVRQLERAIVEVLQPDYLKNPRVAVEVLNYRPFYILGEVNQPGSYAYVNGMRVINAVALAGGFTYRADEDDLWITRAGGTREKASQTTIVRPGDVVEVPERFF